MLKVKLGEIYNSISVLNKVASLSLPAKTSFRLAKILKVINENLSTLEKARTDLVKKYGECIPETKDSQNPQWQVKTDNVNKFVDEMNDMLKEDVELPGNKLRIEEFGDASVSPADLVAISYLIEDETA